MDERDEAGEAGRIDRRKALGLGAAAAGAAWVAPTILTMDAAAAASQIQPIVCTPALSQNWSGVPGSILGVTNTFPAPNGIAQYAPGWSVVTPDIDFVLFGAFGISPTGFNSGDILVDLNGNTRGAIAATIVCPGGTFAAGGRTLSFDYAGSQRGPSTDVQIDVTANTGTLGTQTITGIPSGQGRTTGTLPFVVPAGTTSITVQFTGLGGAPNIGTVLGPVGIS